MAVRSPVPAVEVVILGGGPLVLASRQRGLWTNRRMVEHTGTSSYTVRPVGARFARSSLQCSRRGVGIGVPSVRHCPGERFQLETGDLPIVRFRSGDGGSFWLRHSIRYVLG